MERITLVCDVCGAEQGKENHWWVVFLEGFVGSHFVLVPLAKYRDAGRESVTGQKVQHLCGAECVTRRVSEFMSGAFAGVPR